MHDLQFSGKVTKKIGSITLTNQSTDLRIDSALEHSTLVFHELLSKDHSKNDYTQRVALQQSADKREKKLSILPPY